MRAEEAGTAGQAGEPRLSACQSLRTHHVVLEVARRTGLRPEPDFSGDRRTKHWIVRREQIGIRRRIAPPRARCRAEGVLERELAIEPCLQISTVDRELQLVPRSAFEHELLRAIAE